MVFPQNAVCPCLHMHAATPACRSLVTTLNSGAQLIIHHDTTPPLCARFTHWLFVCFSFFCVSLCSHQGEIQRLDRVPGSGPDRIQDGTGQPAGGGECRHREGVSGGGRGHRMCQNQDLGIRLFLADREGKDRTWWFEALTAEPLWENKGKDLPKGYI